MFKKVTARKRQRMRGRERKKKHEDKTNRQTDIHRKKEARRSVCGKKIKNNIPENRSCPASRPHPVRRGIKN